MVQLAIQPRSAIGLTFGNEALVHLGLSALLHPPNQPGGAIPCFSREESIVLRVGQCPDFTECLLRQVGGDEEGEGILAWEDARVGLVDD